MIAKTQEEIMARWQGEASIPLVSICMRTYNLEAYVEEALDSFLMQETAFPFEIVIDDDCSTDGTVAILRRYEAKFPTIIRANFLDKNIGVRENFIRNIQRARGKYIAPCDGDDYWQDPLNLQKHIAFLEHNHDYVVSYSPMQTRFEDPAMEQEFVWSEADRTGEEIQREFLGTGICAVCFRNVEILHAYPFEHHCAPIDDNFLASLLGAYGAGKFLREIKPAIYRHHGASDYSSKSLYQKAVMYEQNYFALYSYYRRIGEEALSGYFYDKMMAYGLIVHRRRYYATLLYQEGLKWLRARLSRLVR